MPWTQTSDINPDERICDSQHEAAHAVVGVLLGLVFDCAIGVTKGGVNPHCSWNYDHVAGRFLSAR